MTIRSVNTAGTAVSDVVYTDEAGVEQTATATVGHTTFALANTLGSDGDIILLTDSKVYGNLSYTKQMNVYVADNVRHTGVEVADGARCEGSVMTGNNSSFIVGMRFTFAGGIGTTGSDTTVSYVDCVSRVFSSFAPGFKFAKTRNCVAYSAGTTSLGYESCRDAKNCLALSVAGGGFAGFLSCSDLENCISLGFTDPYGGTSGTPGANNMSSIADAPGTNPYNSVTPSAVLVSVASGSADAHWKDQTTAELYAGSDLSVSFIQDMDRNTRGLWVIGPFDFAGNGGGAAPVARSGLRAELGLRL